VPVWVKREVREEFVNRRGPATVYRDVMYNATEIIGKATPQMIWSQETCLFIQPRDLRWKGGVQDTCQSVLDDSLSLTHRTMERWVKIILRGKNDE
jgi:hypothetical protein